MGCSLLFEIQLSQSSLCSHTLNLSTQPKDMQSHQHNSQRVLGRACWSLEKLQEAQGRPKNQHPSKERAEGYKYPTLKNQPLLLSAQTGQTSLFKPTSRQGLDRSDRSPYRSDRSGQPTAANLRTGQTGPQTGQGQRTPYTRQTFHSVHQVKT